MTVNLIIYYIFKLSEKWGSLPLDMLDGKDYNFNVVISQSTDYIEAILPKDYLKKLEKDNVNIFNGVLTSNDGYVKWVE